jgi:hypothetical protein
MKKILIKLILLVVVLGVVAFLARNIIARISVEYGVKKMTGFPLEIGRVDVGLLNGTLEVTNLKLSNPSEFHGGTFVDLPLFKVDYTTLSMLTGSPHIKELVVNVEQVMLVKNEKGEVNAQAIQNKLVAAKPASTGGEQPSEPAKVEKKAKYQVDLVRIHIGTLIKRTYGKDGKPNDIKIVMNVDREFKNISESTSISSLVTQVVFGQLGNVAGELVKGVGDTFKGAGDAVKGAGDALQKTGKGLFDGIKKAIPQK